MKEGWWGESPWQGLQQLGPAEKCEGRKGNTDSWFPTWILTSVPTATLREPFSAFVSLPLFQKERKLKNYCEKNRLCMTRRLEMQNNWFWQKTGLTNSYLIDLALLIGNQYKQGKEK